MGSLLKDILLAWRDLQIEQFPTLVKKVGRKEVFCGREWSEAEHVCATYYGSHDDESAFGKWMRGLMVRLGLGSYTNKEPWRDSNGKQRIKYKGYKGPSFKSLRSFGATFLVGSNLDVKTVQNHFGHKEAGTTLNFYAESIKTLMSLDGTISYTPDIEKRIRTHIEFCLDRLIEMEREYYTQGVKPHETIP